MVRFAWLALLLLGGCTLLEQTSPQRRLAEHVHQTNDERRWGRVDLAAQHVRGRLRESWAARHARWGAEVRIADVDVTNLELGLAHDRAAARVEYAWIDERTMELHRTIVRQIWEPESERYYLVREEVIGGDPELFEDVPEDDEEPLAPEEEEVQPVRRDSQGRRVE